MRSICLLVVLALVASCVDFEDSARSGEVGPTSSVSEVSEGLSRLRTSSTSMSLPECRTGPGIIGLENEYERVRAQYNTKNAAGLVALVGDGPVFDSSLHPDGSGSYGDVADWLEAAERAEDEVTVTGISPGDPLQLMVERRNPTLAEAGIENLAVTFLFWTNQECEYRVEVTEPISSPDPCRFYVVFDHTPPDQCLDSFSLRASHVGVWTGTEVLIYGGMHSLTDSDPLATGLAFDPATGKWRELADAPVGAGLGYGRNAVWTGEHLHVAAVTRDGDDYPVVVLTYTPDTDTWELSPPRPDQNATPGGVVWTGSEVVMAGGDTNFLSNHAWAYNPLQRTWRQLDDMPTEPMEAIEAVVADGEAYFIGGYPDAPTVALDLTTLEWRNIADLENSMIEDHQLVWTGETVVVIGGHEGPSHVPVLRIYNPDTDSWTESAPMPVEARERSDVVWTGIELIVWGGFATYGNETDSDRDFVFADGAAYNPLTDTWRTLSESPLTDRCDHTLTWTGTEMLVFGGLPLCGDLAAGDAALYNPETDTWRLIQP